MNNNYTWGLGLLARYGVQSIPHSGGAGYSIFGVFEPLHEEESKIPLLKMDGWNEYPHSGIYPQYTEMYIHSYWVGNE